MFTLKYIEGKDFFSFEHFSVKFTRGMTLVIGYDEGGKDSNGSGKSTILNAISWALFGRTLKGVSGMDVVRWGCKDCQVILILEGVGHVYEIKRSLEKLVFSIDGTVIRGHYRDIQSAIETSFKTDYALFIRSTAFSQGQVEFLAAAGDAEKKRTFKEVLSLSRLDTAYDKIRVRYESNFRLAEKLEGELEAAAWRKSQLEEKISQAEDARDSWQADSKVKIQTLEDKKRKVPPQTDSLKTEIAVIESKLAEFSALPNDIKETEEKINYLTIEEGSYQTEIDRLWRLIEKGQEIGGRCDLCGSVVTKKMLGAHKRELEDQIRDLKKQRETIVKEKMETQEYLGYLYSIRLNNDSVQRELREKQNRLAILEIEWKHYYNDLQEIDRQIEEIKNGPNPYSDYLSSFVNELHLVDYTISQTKSQFEGAKKLIDTLAFLKFALSREGAINQIIEREYASLVSYSNRMLSEISGGKLRLSISPLRELKSGALKDEIEIRVYVDENKTTYWGLSDGQRQRVNIALLLALNKLCRMKGVNSFDFLLLDEVLDISLADGGQQDVLSLLKNYLRECSNIVLISHKESFKTSFTSCLSVYRGADGVSHLTR